jgi:hypothetical protein
VPCHLKDLAFYLVSPSNDKAVLLFSEDVMLKAAQALLDFCRPLLLHSRDCHIPHPAAARCLAIIFYIQCLRD